MVSGDDVHSTTVSSRVGQFQIVSWTETRGASSRKGKRYFLNSGLLSHVGPCAVLVSYTLLNFVFPCSFSKMNNFFCADCNTQLNSKMQWDQHLTGGKHMRAVALHNKAPGDGISNQSPGTGSRTLSPDMSHAGKVFQICLHPTLNNNSFSLAPDPDGVTFRCKVCPEFECKGPIPMRAHLVGVKHLKALQRQQGLLGTPSRASTPFPALEELSTPIVAMMSLPASCDEDLGGVSGSTPKSDPLIGMVFCNLALFVLML